MKILLISDGIHKHGGWYSYTEILLHALQEKGHSVEEWVPKRQPLSFLTNPFVAPWEAWKLRKKLQAVQPDIVHFTVEPHVLMVPFLPKNTVKKTVVTVHGSYAVRLFQGALNRRRASKTLQSIGACITVSNYTKQRLQDQIDLKNITVIHNAITPPAAPIHRRNSTTKSVICVGGIKPRKGILEALNAVALYKKKYSTNVKFTIIGRYDKDEYFQKIQNTIYANSLNTCVTITGPIDDRALQQYFTTADALLMPAKTTHDTFEGFGLVYIEANAYGVPCIGPNDSGAAEAINNGVSGFTCDPNDPSAIAKALYAILEESVISSKDCRAWAEKHSPKNMAEAVETVYNTLV